MPDMDAGGSTRLVEVTRARGHVESPRARRAAVRAHLERGAVVEERVTRRLGHAEEGREPPLRLIRDRFSFFHTHSH